MPYLRKGELLPIKGYDFSIPSLFTKDGYGFPENMQYERGMMRKRDAKLSLEDLNSDQRVTDAELAIIKAAILAQGINLDDF